MGDGRKRERDKGGRREKGQWKSQERKTTEEMGDRREVGIEANCSTCAAQSPEEEHL